MEDETYIGDRTVWGESAPFGISAADRRQHLYAIGKTGTGKTTLLFNLICQDIERGHGVGVIDPHGDLAEELLNYIPPWRTDHVVYFNPADSEFPIGFNLVRAALPDRQYLEASGLVGAFKHLWRESWGPREELPYDSYSRRADGMREYESYGSSSNARASSIPRLGGQAGSRSGGACLLGSGVCEV